MASKQRFGQNRWTLGMGLIFASALILSSCDSSDTSAAPGSSSTGMPSAAVGVIDLRAEEVASVRELTGRARAYAEAEIRPQVTGLIQRRLFTEGQAVSEREALYQIDPAEYRAAVRSAEAALRGAEANAAAARETAERFERLAEINAVSRQDYENAVAAMEGAEAEIGIREATLARAEIDLERTTVRSPISGQIGRSNVTQGALVTANQSTSLARVLQLDPIYIDLTTASSELLRWKQDVAAGSISTIENSNVPVTIHLENGSEYAETGQLGFSEVSVDDAAGTVIVRAVVPNPGGLLLPGMFVTASFSAGSYDNVFLVPQRALQRNPRGDGYVYVVDENNTAQTRNVSILESQGSNWVVTDGLEDGDQLIVSGFQSIRAGAPVRITSRNGEAVSSPSGPAGGHH